MNTNYFSNQRVGTTVWISNSTLFGAIPALTVRPVSLCTISRISWTHSSAASKCVSQYSVILEDQPRDKRKTENLWRQMTYLRYPSSHPPGCMLGSYLLNISMTLFEISIYRGKWVDTTTSSGQSFLAMNSVWRPWMINGFGVGSSTNIPAIPDRTPCFLASYDAVDTTPWPTYTIRHALITRLGWTHCKRFSLKRRII